MFSQSRRLCLTWGRVIQPAIIHQHPDTKQGESLEQGRVNNFQVKKTELKHSKWGGEAGNKIYFSLVGA